MKIVVKKNSSEEMTYLEWAQEEKDWLSRGKQIYLGGIRHHKIDLSTNITEQKSFLINILNSIDKTLLLLETIDEFSSEEYLSTLFKNVITDIDNLKQDNEIFLTSGGFNAMKNAEM